MRADDLRGALGAIDIDRDALRVLACRHAGRVETQRNAFGLEKRRDRARHILVFARDQPRRHLDDGHAAAETAVHLRELEPDIAAADDDEMLG